MARAKEIQARGKQHKGLVEDRPRLHRPPGTRDFSRGHSDLADPVQALKRPHGHCVGGTPCDPFRLFLTPSEAVPSGTDRRGPAQQDLARQQNQGSHAIPCASCQTTAECFRFMTINQRFWVDLRTLLQGGNLSQFQGWNAAGCPHFYEVQGRRFVNVDRRLNCPAPHFLWGHGCPLDPFIGGHGCPPARGHICPPIHENTEAVRLAAARLAYGVTRNVHGRTDEFTAIG